MPKKVKYSLLLLMFSIGFMVDVRIAGAQTSSYEELQAAYIFNFAKYVNWPDNSSVFVIGVYGDQDIMGFLEKAFNQKKIGGRQVTLKPVLTGGDMSECNIVYVSESGSRSLKTLMNEIGKKSILVVTEEDLIKRGAGISFVVEDERLKFKLNKPALSAARLMASEGLLKLAILE